MFHRYANLQITCNIDVLYQLLRRKFTISEEFQKWRFYFGNAWSNKNVAMATVVNKIL